MSRRFVVISGLPGSGKTTLAGCLAPLLQLPVLDKDDILECLFDSKGAGDAAWRRRLSREGDAILKQRAAESPGAIIVSFWHREGMPADSGTPAGWLRELHAPMVHLHCVCPPEIAAERYLLRKRHEGHLDKAKSYEDVLASLRSVDRFQPIRVAQRCMEVDTSRRVDSATLAQRLETIFGSEL